MFNGQKIKDLFEERKVQQTTFTLQTGVSKSNLYVWMENRSRPGADALEKIADFFNLPIDYFFDRNISPDNHIGHTVSGNGNKVTGDIALSECQSEVVHLKELLRQKDELLKEKERLIKVLMKE